MRIKPKLIIAFLACSIAPLAALGVLSFVISSGGMGTLAVSSEEALEKASYNQLVALRDVKKRQVERYFADRRGDMNVLVETVATLQAEAFNKLTAVRETKLQAVERYFKTIEDQMLTFSQNGMVVEAMSAFPSAFRAAGASADGSGDAALLAYYTGDFGVTYQGANNGADAGAAGLLRRLDVETRHLQHLYISDNPHPLGSKHLLDAAGDGSEYSRLHAEYHPVIRSYLEKFGYYDIFLVDIESGKIVYSVFKELDYGTSLLDGPYADTNFAEAFRRAAASDDPDALILVDYKQYKPSYEAPAGFIASPVFDGDEKVGVAVFQMPIDRLNGIMAARAGLGDTGETYLVGPDKLMRSDSYLDPELHTVDASFRYPATGGVDTEAANRALGGESGADVIIDYNGNPVLSAFAPVKVGDYTWAILAEIDVAEAFAPHIEGEEEDFFTRYMNEYGYYDLFLLNPDGYCFYSVTHEADYQTNLIDGKYKDSNFGGLVREVVKSKRFGFADFAPYAPSAGAPAAFIAEPIVVDDRIQAVVALQLPLDAINEIMGVRAGMGDTGETYLVGSDLLMRSDSYLDPVGHSVVGSFADPSRGSADTEAVRAALGGATDAKIIMDYNGNPVLSAFAPIEVFGERWALLAEIDQAEAFASVVEMEGVREEANGSLMVSMLLTAGVAGVLVSIAAWILAVGLAKPVLEMVRQLKDIAEGEGDLTRRVNEKRKDEYGELGKWFNAFVSRIHDVIVEVSRSAKDVAAASAEIANTADQMKEGMEDQARQATQVSAAVEEMSASVVEVAQKSSDAANSANESGRVAEAGGGVVSQTVEGMKAIHSAVGSVAVNIQELGERGDQIGQIIEVINDIADQTNLLALNAAIEAARAGEHGRGFAVVADEVRKLADRTTKATEEIGESIKMIQQETGAAVERMNDGTTQVTQGVELATEAGASLQQIVSATRDVTAMIQSIASAAQQQSTAGEEVSRSVDQISAISTRSLEATAQAADAASHLSGKADELQRLIGRFRVNDRLDNRSVA